MVSAHNVMFLPNHISKSVMQPYQALIIVVTFECEEIAVMVCRLMAEILIM